MTLTLLVISLVASAALGLVYQSTKEPIAKAQMAKINSAIEAVVPEFNNQPFEESYKVEVDGGELVFYPAKKDGQLVGTAVKTFSKNGFSGLIELMVGFLPDGSINKVAVVSHKETPGLGDKMEPSKSNFSLQFEGKNPETFKVKVKKDGGDVDAITASTISSRAYCDAVTRAYNTLKEGGKK
ncbi:MAG TPA: RnfABCDGE type electron transport complex subunit G [Tenuifilaceae bacterium]|mgnify:FL=1|nr:RnfABCDGE type electron transport complex subunit G [Tenuifilaceae bacterium]HOZ15221.1 RnfABCDGE type electron transport complex subunit G [Tenuifilaceae bacterium]HPI44987.1 RnfABCDGE type electron transport complex subunit G [Tenuifilaceae bacterium]HPN22106.1 RnfABCDGE type electron transport complex subunit G [Tenuifilaceae bacterium]